MRKNKILFFGVCFLMSFSCFAGEITKTVYEGEEWLKKKILPIYTDLSPIYEPSFWCKKDDLGGLSILRSFMPDNFFENCQFKDIYFLEKQEDKYSYKIIFFCEKDEYKNKNLEITLQKKEDSLCMSSIGHGYDIELSDE